MRQEGLSQVSFGDLSSMLSRERELLERLLVGIEMTPLLESVGDRDSLAAAQAENEHVKARLRAAWLERDIFAAAVADAWGVDSEPTLPKLIASAPSGPWADALRSHHAALAELCTSIGNLSEAGQAPGVEARFLARAAEFLALPPTLKTRHSSE